ncbi:LamG-like jellyroll fold domain-containing protein [Luteolibacter soli]|uniref:LamG-like jellyroll fold domain-containing protein n=1 Tax=Luteolibacter soli TaxID=3135280 RepID=A0ABU9AZZ9_9BACT
MKPTPGTPGCAAVALVGSLFLLATSASHGQLTVSDSVQTYATLTNTAVTVTGKSELHITGTSNPIAGSTINLNSEDSWLWFDNLRPTTADDYLSQIKVNGATAVHGTNVRVVQYGNGTVITPFTNAVQPLQTFTDPKFSGDSKSYSLYTYYDSAAELGVMNRNISSFKLKRGYMATFGTQTNGTGISKVYIAQDHDLTIANMPANLDNAVQFVRVFPWRWVSKKGSCDVSADVLNAAWFYNWNNDQNSTLNWEYVPIRQQRYWPSLPTAKTSITHLSGFNEPDNSVEDSYTSLDNGSRDSAIAAWPELLATGLRVGSPACTDGGRWWLYEFMDKANAAGLRVDYITIHFYQCGQSAASLKSFLQEIWDRYHKPIWLTEFNNGANWTGCGDPTTDQNATAIGNFIDMMDDTPWIERYAVYSNVEWQRNMTWDARFDGGSGLTPAGIVYRDQKSPIGYLQESYPMGVKRGVVQLTLDGNTKDTSGYDNRGVCYGVPTYTAGQHGQALDFNGSNNHVELPPAIANTNAFTFAAWVNWDGGAANQRIFDFGNDTTQFFFLSPNVGGEMRVGLRNGSGTTGSIATSALPSGSWQHVAVTMQGSTARIYLNGVQQVQGTLSDPALSGTMQNYLGKSQWAADPLFNGKLDDVTIADSAMSADQIAALMANTLPPFAAHWQGDVDGSWSTNNAGNTNWVTAAGGSTDAGQAPAINTAVSFSPGGASPSSTTLGADFTIDSLSVTTPSPVGIGGTHNLTIGATGIEIASSAGPTAINTTGQVNVGVDQTWTNNSANPLTVSSAISGTAELRVTGAGTVALTGTNLTTGNLSIFGGGTVSVPNIASTLGTMTRVGMGGGGLEGKLVYTGSGETSGRVLTFQGGFGTPGMILDQSGTGLLKFTSNTASIASVAKTLTLQGSSSGAGEFAGIIANGSTTTSLTKAGSGIWTLSATNTYTGTTALNAGTLAIANNAALGTSTLDFRGGAIQSSDASTRTIANAISVSADAIFSGTGNLLFTGAANAGSLPKAFIVNNARTELSGVLSGSGARSKAGFGKLVLSGVNTYTGATTVSAGTLEVNGSLAVGTAVTVANGAVLTGTGSVKGSTAFANGSRFGWSLASNSATAGKLTAAAVTVTSGAGVNLTFNGPGSTIDFTDAFWTQSHNWQVLASTGMTGAFALSTVTTDSAGHSAATAGSFYLQQTSGGLKLFFSPIGSLPPSAPSGLTTSIMPGGVTLAWNSVVDAAGYNVLRSTHAGGPYEIVATDIVGSSYTDRAVANGTPYYYVIVAVSPNGESPPSAEIVATPHLPSVIDKADNATDLSLAASWSGGVAPSPFDTARWSGLAGANFVLTGSDLRWSGLTIGDTAGAVTIGSGNTLTLGQGGIDMSSATQNLTISSTLVLGAGQSWKVATGKTFTLVGSPLRSPGATLLVDKSTFTGTVTAALPVTDGITGPWSMVKSAGTSANGAAGGFTFATVSGGNVVPYTSATPLTTGLWTAPGANTVNYDVSGATLNMGVSRVAKTLRYTGAAATTYTVNSGATLTVNGMLNAGGGLWTYNPGVIIGSSGNNELVLGSGTAGLALTGIIANGPAASSVTVAGQGTVTLSGANTYTGGTYVSSGKLVASPTALNSGPITIQSAGTLTFNGNNLTSTSAVSGSGAILNDTANTIVFTGDHSGFTGSFTHTAGANNTQFNSATSGSPDAAYTITAGELIFALNGNYTVKMGSLASTGGNIRGGNSATGTTTLEVGQLGTNTSIVGNLNNGTTKVIALTKVGTGILTVLGPNNYSGGTTISRGTLMANGTLTGTGTAAVNNGGALAGTGTVSAPVTVAGGGTLSPGNGSGGVLTLAGAVSLQDGSALEIGLGTNSSRLAVGGAFSADGSVTVNLKALAGFGPGTYQLITGATGISETNFTVGTIPAGYACVLTANAGTLSATVAIPPAIPASLTATGDTSEIVLNWTASPSAASYNIKRSTEAGSGYSTISTGVTTANYIDAGLTVGTTYYYVVSAVNTLGESADSNEASALVLSASESWRKQHFGSTEETGDAADAADPDGDGLSNLIEFALGTLPNQSSADTAPEVSVINGKLTITATRNTGAIDVVMTILASDDLTSENWQPIARSAGGSPFTDIIQNLPTGATIQETGTGATRTVQISDIQMTNDPAHPKRFLKLQVER